MNFLHHKCERQTWNSNPLLPGPAYPQYEAWCGVTDKIGGLTPKQQFPPHSLLRGAGSLLGGVVALFLSFFLSLEVANEPCTD